LCQTPHFEGIIDATEVTNRFVPSGKQVWIVADRLVRSGKESWLRINTLGEE
jgi:hypothetical protein